MFSPSDIEESVRQALVCWPRLSLLPHPSPAADRDLPAQLSVWAQLVVHWNARMDLTAARNPAELVDLLLADAAHLATHAKAQSRWVDVGTGAGAPGLGLAIFRPDLHVTLVEPRQKRVAFLRTVLGTLRCQNVTVIRCRGEDVVRQGQRFDAAVARATLPPPAWLALGHQLAPNGSVVGLLANQAAPTLAGRVVAKKETYVWPLTQTTRSAVWWSPTEEDTG